MPTPTEWLNEFQVNTGTAATGSQSDPHIIGLANGNILVAWTESASGLIGTTAGTDIIGVIYDAEGNVVRSAYRLNTNRNADDEGDFDIAATNDGGFVMVYVDDDISNVNQTTIMWERFNSTGNAIDNLQIDNENVAADFLANPQVAVNQLTNESYVTYTDDVGTDRDITGLIVSAAGVAGTPFAAGQNSADVDEDGDVAILTNGSMVSVYEELDGSDRGIEFVIRTTAGVLVSNGAVDNLGVDPQVTALANGNFVVTWQTTDDTHDDVNYRVYNSSGTSVAGPFTVQSDGLNIAENEPEIVALPDGDFVIIWDNDTTNSLQGRRLNADGSADGSIFTIENVGVTTPEIGVTADGRLLFTWSAGGEIHMSIWDPRSSTIDVADYSNSNLRNFVETNVVTSLTTSSTVNGSSSSDTILGQGGNDSLLGASGADSIIGGAGNDTILGGFATDTVAGGLGNDSIVILNGEFIDQVSGDGGTDTLDLSDISNPTEAVNLTLGVNYTGLGGTRTLSSIEVVNGTQGDDTLNASNQANATINGEGGNDSIIGGLDDQTLNGGDGNDTIDGGFAAGSGVSDSISGGAGDDNLIGANGADTINGDGNNDIIQGHGGADILSGGTGLDTVSYAASSSGVNVLLNSSSNTGGHANGDSLSSFEAIMGSAFNDTLNANSLGSSTINGGAGNDSIIGGSNAQTLNGGAGNDTIDGGFAAGSGVSDSITGGAGNDNLMGAGNADTINGDGDNDFIQGNGGADSLNGGTGIDTVSYANSSAGVTVTLNSSVNTGGDAQGDLLSGFEVLTGSGHDDVLNGATGATQINGGNGDDTIDGQSSGAELNGGFGDDVLTFRTGSSAGVNGGSGTDTLDMSSVFGGGTIYWDLNAGYNTTGHGDPVIVTFSSIENFLGTIGTNNNVLGTAGNNHLTGAELADTLDGADGNDTLLGEAGGDQLNGRDGDDLIYGGDDNDVVTGGLGDDTAYGNTGNDTINTHGGDDVINAGAGDDSIGGQFGLDTLIGGAGMDTIFGGGSNDSITGGTENDSLNGNQGADTILGQGGDDYVRGGEQADYMDGGSGNDSLIGDVGNDTMIGNAGNDTLNGGGNADSMTGGAGNDLLRGQDGFDTMDGGTGNDTLTGGTGNDDFVFGLNYDSDRVNDFADNADELYLNDNLWGGGLTAQQVVDTYATVSGGNTILDFGGGDVLTVVGVTDEQILVNDIVIF